MPVIVNNPVTKIVQVGSAGSSVSVDALATRLVSTGSYLESLIQVSNAGVSSLNGKSGTVLITGSGNVTVVNSGQLVIISGIVTETGHNHNNQYYPLVGNPSGFLTGFNSGLYALKSETGVFITTSMTGHNHDTQYYPLIGNPSGFLTGFNSGLYVLKSETGTLVPTGATGNFITTFQTGHNHDGQYYPLGSNPSNYVTTSQTGILVPTGLTGVFLTTGQTGVLVNTFYPLNTNPSNYVVASQTGTLVPTGLTGVFAEKNYVNNASGAIRADLVATGSFLYGLIQASSAGVGSLNGQSGSLTLSGTGNVTVIVQGQTIYVSGNTGAYANFVYKGETGTFVTSDKTGIFVTSSQTGTFVTTSQTGVLINAFYPLDSNPSNYVATSQTGIFVPTGATGAFVNMFYPLVANPNNYVTMAQTGTLVPTGLTGVFVTTGQSGLLVNVFYPLNSNPSNYVTTAQTGTLVPTGLTGMFATTGQLKTIGRSLFLETPVVGDRVLMFWTNDPITLKRVKSVIVPTGGTPSVSYKLTQSSGMASVTSGVILDTVESNQTTGTLYTTSLANSNITGLNYVFFECYGVSNIHSVSVTLEY